MSHLDQETDSEVTAVLQHVRTTTVGATGTFHPSLAASLVSVQPNMVSRRTVHITPLLYS